MNSESSIETRPFKERPLLYGIIILGIVLRLIVYLGTGWVVFDGLIGFRFAEQFAAGNGLVFNVGERVGGNTSVLYTLLLGLGGWAGLSIPVVSRVLGILCDVGSFLVVKRLLETDSGIRSGALRLAVAGAVYLWPMLLIYSVSGMETPLYILLMLLLLQRTLKEVDWRYYLWAALVLFCRPDGVVPIAVSAGYLTLRQRRIPWALVGGMAAIGASYGLFNYLYYGSVVPLSVAVKAFVYHSTPPENFNYIAARFFRGRIVLVLFLAVLSSTVVCLRRESGPLLLTLMSFGLLVFLLMAPILRSWYPPAFVTVSTITVLIGACRLVEAGYFHLPRTVLFGVAASYLVVASIGFGLIFNELKKVTGYTKALVEDVGVWINQNTRPDAKIFVTALETGYYAKRYMLDTPGLVTPRVLRMLKEQPQLDAFGQAEALKADYAVIPMAVRPTGGPSAANEPPNADLIRVPTNFHLLKVFKYETDLREFKNLDYHLFQRSD